MFKNLGATRITLALAAGLLLLGAPALAATGTGTKTVNVNVPTKLVFTVDAGVVSLTADPAAADGANKAVGAAIVSVNTNAKLGAAITAQAGNLANGTPADDIAAANLQYSVTTLDTWTGFNTADTAVVTAPKGSTTYTYDYQVLRDWNYAPGAYTTTVTYTATTL